MKKIDVIPKENVLRITDEDLLAKLNEDYARKQGTIYTSRNAYLNDVLRIGSDVIEKQHKDDWVSQKLKEK